MSTDFVQRTWLKTFRLVDVALICVTFLTALAMSPSALSWPSVQQVLVIRVKVVNIFLFIGYIALCAAVLRWCGLYRLHRLSRWPQRFFEMIIAVTLLAGILWLLRSPLSLEFATNAFLSRFWLMTLCGILLTHEIALRFLRHARLRGRNLRNVVIVGDRPGIAALVSRIKQDSSLGYRVHHIIEVGEMSENGRNTNNL